MLWSPNMDDDPLVTRSGNGFAGWLNTVRHVTERSGKPVLLISLVGIAVPTAIASMTTSIMGVEGYISPSLGDVQWLLGRLPEVMVDLLVALAVVVGSVYVASAALAASAWTIVEESITGQPASIVQAFRFGFDRARWLWLWSLAIGLVVKIGLMCCLVPGVYAIYACSLFAFVGVFERLSNPVFRSMSLTHRGIRIALLRIPLSLLPCVIFTLVYSETVNTTFKAAFGIGNHLGTTTKVGLVVLNGIQTFAEVVLLAPSVGAVMIALLVTYAELRACESPLTTQQLRTALLSRT